MNIRHLFLFGIIAVIGTILFCGDDPISSVDDDDPVIDHTVRGTWRDTITSSLTTNITYIEITVSDSGRNDSVFTLYAIESPDKYLYVHSGNWEISGDSLKLYGDSCLIIDKGTNTLVPADDTTKTKVIAIDTTGTGVDIWPKKIITEFADVWRAIPIVDPQFESFLKSQFIEMTKLQKDTSNSFF